MTVTTETAPSRILAGTILILCCLFPTGCSSSKSSRAASNDELIQLTRFWRPYLLYVLASPHPRLYVEVDAVEGCEPSEVTLNKLQDFLTAYCDKPEGIEIVRNDVIALKAARGISRTSLARKFLDGPEDKAGTPPPAFMYLLFYDGKLCDQPAEGEARQAGASAATHSQERNKNPHVDFLPYPAAVFINTRYGPKRVRDEIPLHEAGHLLGLAGRPITAANYHCLDTSCLMNAKMVVHIGRLLTGRDPVKQKKLCQQCVAQLTESSRQPQPANLRFVGPVLVRSEAGYHVLSLPARVKLIVGNLTEQDCRDFAAAVRAETTPADADSNAWRCDAFAKGEMLDDPAKVHDILKQAKEDPYELVRNAASKLNEAIKAE